MGDEGEARAARWLQARGLRMVEAHYRVARGPHARGGEIDLIARDADGTLVFVEVRLRADTRHGGAAATVTPAKRRSLVFAATCYLQRFAEPPPCRFDVVAIDGDEVTWLRGAFDAGR